METFRTRRREDSHGSGATARSTAGVRAIVVACVGLVLAWAVPALAELAGAGGANGAEPVSVRTLLAEMCDRAAAARLPSPARTCVQFSSYDRASKSAEAGASWFANNDAGQFLRTESRPDGAGGNRQEFVLMDASGPGAVVRFWSANPAGTLRVYLDDAPRPVIEASMEALLGGRATLGTVPIREPFAGARSRGFNLFLPVPFARRCVITSDAGGFYYQINVLKFTSGTAVESFQPGQLAAAELDAAGATLLSASDDGGPDAFTPLTEGEAVIAPGGSHEAELEGAMAVRSLEVTVRSADLTRSLRTLILEAEFDDESAISCPVGDFFGSGVGANPMRDRFREFAVEGDKATGRLRWVMPFARQARLRLRNLDSEQVTASMSARIIPWTWDERSMHFRAAWRQERGIRTKAGAGVRDWNYVRITGAPGMFVGDSLVVTNPVAEWWGEGDEKIYVDGEVFPSHFGTGTEDYYGYAWCSPEPFQHPFHAQVRCDGHAGGNNWGQTVVSRVRGLDAIPFTSSFTFDMEIWHWSETNVAYAVTTYFYARPGAKVSLLPVDVEARAPLPVVPALPPPFRIDGAIECETMEVVARSPGLELGAQDMRGFRRRIWSNEQHLWVRGRKIGDFVELRIPVPDNVPRTVTVHATRSWDYGIVRFSAPGAAGVRVDLFSGGPGQVEPSAPIQLGVMEPKNGSIVLRAEVVGGNPLASGNRAFFGVDYVVLSPAR